MLFGKAVLGGVVEAATDSYKMHQGPEATNTPEPADKWGSFGIAARMAVLVCGLVAATSAAGALWSYRQLNANLVEEEFSRQRGALESVGAMLTAGLEALRQDAGFLADIPATRQLVAGHQDGQSGGLSIEQDAVRRQRLSAIFESKLRKIPQYLQIRLIGKADGGREMVRVERRGAGTHVTPAANLQKKGGRRYFQEAIKLPPGAIYLSPIELNEEEGEVSLPVVPVLRAATAVYAPDGRAFAIVVTNKDMRPQFARMLESLAPRYSVYLFDEHDQFLLHSDPQRTFTFQRGQPFRASDEFPQLAGMLGSGDVAQYVMEHATAHRTVVASLKKIRYDPGHSSRYYGLMVTSDYQAAVAPGLARRNEILILGLLLTAATLGTVLVASRKITRPLRQIIQAVDDFAAGTTPLDLPVQAQDEAGVLARAFDRMCRQVREQHTALGAEVAERRRTEEALRHSEQQLRLALSGANAGIWEWDLTTDQTVWDQSIESMAGFDRVVFPGTIASWIELMHPEDMGNVPEAKRRALEANRPYEVEFRILGRKGD